MKNMIQDFPETSNVSGETITEGALEFKELKNEMIKKTLSMIHKMYADVNNETIVEDGGYNSCDRCDACIGCNNCQHQHVCSDYYERRKGQSGWVLLQLSKRVECLVGLTDFIKYDGNGYVEFPYLRSLDLPFCNLEADAIYDVGHIPGIEKWWPLGANFLVEMSWLDCVFSDSADLVADFLTGIGFDPDMVLSKANVSGRNYELEKIAKIFKRYHEEC